MEELKSILLELVAEVTDLRATQAVLAVSVPHPPTMAEARDAKAAALKSAAQQYKELRGRIEKLSLGKV